MSVLQIPTAEVFAPLLLPSRYKGAHGGRGSGKSHFFAERMVTRAMCEPGFRGVCIREIQRSLEQSAKRLIEDKIITHGLSSRFEILRDQIKTPGGGAIIFQGMQDHTAESVKSLEGFDVAWTEEAQSLSQRSLTLLRPTIRKTGSELWFSWNRSRKTDPVDKLLTGDGAPTGSVVVNANWRDNPWFPAELEQERLDDQRDRPDTYDHIWEGDYAKVTEGAYYAKSLTLARAEGRIARLAPDPLMTYRAIWDIGGTGAKADATAIWICQYVGRELWFLDYYEARGQPLSAHVHWLRSNGYGHALCILPHDGSTQDRVHDASFEGSLKRAGFEVKVIPNQGRGAAMMRIQAARDLFGRCWFDEIKTEHGLAALGGYHEKRDEVRNIGLGPDHDEWSHGADAFGLAAVAYQEPGKRVRTPQEARQRNYGSTPTSWMGA